MVEVDVDFCYGERLAEIGAVRVDRNRPRQLDDALAETLNGYYKAEPNPNRTAPGRGRRRGGRAGDPGRGTGTTPSA